jgi:hypothetical protein
VGVLGGRLMDMHIVVTVQPGLLRVQATGHVSLEPAKRTFLEVLDAVAQHGNGAVLFDGTALTGAFNDLERFQYGEFIAHAVLAFMEEHPSVGSVRFAYVLVPPVQDPQRLGETVAVNRGMVTRVFGNTTDAIHWLEHSTSGR